VGRGARRSGPPRLTDVATSLSPKQTIDRLRTAFGGPAGHRTLHAKGRFYTGTFTATPEATALCRAGHFDGGPHEVTVRWSNAAGKAR
jgi:catalase